MFRLKCPYCGNYEEIDITLNKSHTDATMVCDLKSNVTLKKVVD